MNTGTQREEQRFDNQSQSGRNQSASTSGDGQNNQTNSEMNSNIDYTELKYRDPANVATGKMAKGIGMFSIALGLAEVVAPARMGELIGVSNRYRAFLPLLGMREIAHGIGIMSQTKPTESVWSRVIGDAIDLAFLGAAFAGKENNKRRLAGATVAVLGVAALDVMCAAALSKQQWNDTGGNLNAPTTVGQPSARQMA
ncbi:MAG TPA: hypothetical protein VGC97_18505 [Pyrinomonadaceae bacterium]